MTCPEGTRESSGKGMHQVLNFTEGIRKQVNNDVSVPPLKYKKKEADCAHGR